MAIVKTPEQIRLRIMDGLLSQGITILTRTHFLKLINDKTPADISEISIESVDKYISKIKDLAAESEVKLLYKQGRGYYYTQRGFSIFKTDVNYEDKNLLMLAASVFSLFKGTQLQEKFSNLVNRVLESSNLGGSVMGLTDQHLLKIGSEPIPKGNEHIPRLLEAILEEECLEMQYRGIDKPLKKKHICPYFIKKYLNRWFLVAYDHTSERQQKTSVFALDGIQQPLEISNRKFVHDPNFSPEDFFNYSIGVWHWHDRDPVKVELIFSGYIDQIIYSPLHHSQTHQLSKDKKTLHVQIEVYETPELEMLIHSFGDKVKVLSPQSLADTIKKRALNTVALYNL